MIEAKILEDNKKERLFPKVMKGVYGTIVLFSEPTKGVVIKNGDNHIYTKGWYYSNWEMSHFTDYNEPITIQNA